MNIKFRFEQLLINLILLCGVTLSLIQFFYNRSLWLDEAKVALNIIHKNCFELLKPLDYNQVAPILFLQLEKLFSLFIPNSEYGLRLLPLLCFWFSLYFFYQLVKILFKNFYSILFALALFIFNAKLIYFSSEVKQYMADVLVITSTYYFIVKSYKNQVNKYRILSMVGIVSIFLSNIAPIVLMSGWVFLFYSDSKSKTKTIKHLLNLSSIWLSVFIVYYCFFIYHHSAKDSMINYWQNANAFMPCNPFKKDFYVFLFQKFNMIFTSLFHLGILGKICLPLLALVGVVILFYQKRIAILILLLMPIIIHLLFSSITLYPFDLRLILYICPVFILLFGFGFDYLTERFFSNFKMKRLQLILLIIPAILFFLFYKSGFPIENEEIKKSIDYIQQHKMPDDKIYIYYGAAWAYNYYQRINYATAFLPATNGTENRKNNSGYITEITHLRGRNWLLFAHSFYGEDNYIIKQLGLKGYSSIETFKTTGSNTLLYNFKE